MRQPGEVRPLHVRSYLVVHQDAGLSDYTVHAAARSLRAYFNFGVHEELLPVSPMANVGMPKVNQRVVPAFTPEEVQRHLAVCTCQRDRPILLDTGVRSTEMLALNGADVDAQTGVVNVWKGKGMDRPRHLSGRQEPQTAAALLPGMRGARAHRSPVGWPTGR